MSNKINPTHRLVLSRQRHLEAGSYTKQQIIDLFDGKDDARLEIECYYDETSITINWSEPESDDAYAERMRIITERETKLAEKIAKKLARARARQEREAVIIGALSKLTDEERLALGIKIP